MLLLFDTHVGGSVTDCSFKSHLSISHQTSFTLIKRIGGIRTSRERRHEECVFIPGHGCDDFFFFLVHS